MSPSGKAWDSDSHIRGFETFHPSQINTKEYDPLAQSVEHLTFNQGVRSSNLRQNTMKRLVKTSRFLYFCDKKCDIAIIETGLGGRLDATNALTNVIASVITKIGLDHTAILGDSIEKITAEKCGIIKNVPVITSFNQCEGAMSVLGEHNPVIPDKESLKISKSDIYFTKDYF